MTHLFLMMICWLKMAKSGEINSISCNNASQCVGKHTKTNETFSDVYAYGYKSIAGNTSSIDSAYNVWCDAAFGCYSSLFINAGGDVWCRGTGSCAESVINHSQMFFTNCDGSNSCQGTSLKTATDIHCKGDSSCSYTNIVIRDTTNIDINGFGSHSLMSSSIETPGSNAAITINLYGYKSGYGLNISCKPSDICNINWFNNSGKSTDIKCNGNCNIINISDPTNFTFVYVNSFNDSLYHIYDSKLLTINYDNICNQHPNASLADNYGEYEGADQIINGGSICCRGCDSCRYAKNIEIHSTNQDAIVCSGYHGCDQVDTIHNNGPVMCGGVAACSNADISTTDNVHCSSVLGCFMSTVYNAINIFCTGFWSCKQTKIIAAADMNIYLLAYQSGENMVVDCNNNYCSIFCQGFEACKGLKVHNNSYTASPTIDPSISPTIEPTASPSKPSNNPTKAPSASTSDPSCNPSQSPSNNPSEAALASTINPTSAPNKSPTDLTAPITSTSTTFKNIIIIIVIIICVIMICIVTYCIKKNKQQKATKNETLIIKNPMILLIGIGDYDEEAPNDADFDGYVSNLDVDIDINNLSALFGDKLGYQTFPKYDKYPDIHWKQEDLINFLSDKAQIFEGNVETEHDLDDNNNNNDDKFDGLLIVISSHGMDNNIITSDYKLISKEALHRIFSSYHPKSRTVPRIVIYDCCDGIEDMKGKKNKKPTTNKESESKIDEKDNIETGKGYTIKDIPVPMLKDDDSDGPQPQPLWERDTKNPDNKLVTIHAANTGFQSKMNSHDGSYLIHKFVKKSLIALKKDINDQPFLHEIFDEIQHELGERQQLPISTYNNNTMYIKFVANTDDNDGKQINDKDEENVIGKRTSIELVQHLF